MWRGSGIIVPPFETGNFLFETVLADFPALSCESCPDGVGILGYFVRVWSVFLAGIPQTAIQG